MITPAKIINFDKTEMNKHKVFDKTEMNNEVLFDKTETNLDQQTFCPCPDLYERRDVPWRVSTDERWTGFEPAILGHGPDYLLRFCNSLQVSKLYFS